MLNQRTQQIRGSERLDETVVHACLAAFFVLSGEGIGGQGNDRGFLQAGILTQVAGRFVAVHDRHLAIHENAVRQLVGDRRQRLRAVVGGTHGYSGLLEHVAHDFLIEGHIVNQQNVQAFDEFRYKNRVAVWQRSGFNFDTEEGGYFGIQLLGRGWLG